MQYMRIRVLGSVTPALQSRLWLDTSPFAKTKEQLMISQVFNGIELTFVPA
jgi:hypothetical protein